MHRPVLFWIECWRKRKLFFAILVVLWLCLCGFFALQLRLTSDITAALPNGEGFKELIETLNASGAKETLYIAVPKEKDKAEFQQKLEVEIGAYVDSGVELLVPDLADPELLYARAPSMLLPSDLALIDSLMQHTSATQAVEEALQLYSTPGAWFPAVPFTKDPYGIMSILTAHLAQAEPLSPLLFDQEGARLRSGREVLVYHIASSEDRKTNGLLLDALNNLQRDFKKDGTQLEFFSPLLIETGNVSQIQKDLRSTLLIAVICILVLLVLVYRGLLTPLLFVLPGVFGLLFALGLLGFWKGEVVGMAIGAGSVVFGIVLDYSFHFFTHYRRSGSLRTTIQDVAGPLATSCLTTVLAFGLLTFTDAPLLQEFGLFAAFSLLGTAVGVLLVLPVFLKAEQEPIHTKWKLPKIGLAWARPVMLAIIVLVSIFFFTRLGEASFDANLDNLNFYPEELQRSEALFSGIEAGKEKRLFLQFENGQERDVQAVEDALQELKQRGSVKGYVLHERLAADSRTQASRNTAWVEFWLPRKDQLLLDLDEAGKNLGLNPRAFAPFERWISQAGELGESENGVSFLVVTVEELEAVKQQLERISGVEVVDPRAGSRAMVTSVQDNFNFIVIGSSMLVLLVLLLIYGRVELTIITFLPMALSWVWIVGATTLLGIQFNFVNIILATFIFGLGDDFAIFISSGYLNKYKYGRGELASDKLAISLSAVTTLIGMAALLFAEHPAVRSISNLSILGMLVILFMSLFLQPYLYKIFIVGRTKKGLQPFTFTNLLFSIYVFGLFGSLCVLASLFTLLLLVIPIKKEKKQWLLRKLLQIGCALILDTAVSVKKQRLGKENFDFSKPAIIVTGHQSFIDILQLVSLSPWVVIMVKKWVYVNPLFGPMVRYAGYLYSEHSPEHNDQVIKQRIAEGCSIAVFPEGTRSPEGEFRRWHKGAMYMSEHYELDVIPIVLHGYGHTMPKNDVQLSHGTITYKVLPRIIFNDYSFGVGYKVRTKRLSELYRAAYAQVALEYAGINYHFRRIVSSFIFKGPIVEWYFRVKWGLEKEVLQLYDDLLPREGKVLDLGCGLGYSSLYLHLRSAERNIVGVDHDEEKILLAQHHYLKGSTLEFEQGDLREYNPLDPDGILLGDVLHYLQPDEQKALLERCAKAMRPGAVILIRDGVTDEGQRQKQTEKTELWSTRIFKFNKTDGELHFFSTAFITDFAERHGLSVQIPWRSNSNSNTLFMLKKPDATNGL